MNSIKKFKFAFFSLIVVLTTTFFVSLSFAAAPPTEMSLLFCKNKVTVTDNRSDANKEKDPIDKETYLSQIILKPIAFVRVPNELKLDAFGCYIMGTIKDASKVTVQYRGKNDELGDIPGLDNIPVWGKSSDVKKDSEAFTSKDGKYKIKITLEVLTAQYTGGLPDEKVVNILRLIIEDNK